MLSLVDHYAQEARRERFVGGGLSLALASSQLGVGVYGYVGLGDEGTGMRRSAISQMAVGSIGVVTSVVQLATATPLERLIRSPHYGILLNDPGDPAAYEALREQWGAAAKRGRKRRFVLGGIALGVGAVLTTAASVRLATSDTSNTERVWAHSTLASGLGTVFGGVAAILLPSASERSFAAVEAAQQPPTRPRVQVAPSIGGITLQGRF